MHMNIYILLWLFGIALISSCQNELDKVLNKKLTVLGNVDSSRYMGYHIYSIREGPKDTSFKVIRVPNDENFAIIQKGSKLLIEKNFSSGDSIDISFVMGFANLDCIYLFFTHEFKRIDYLYKNQDDLSSGKKSAAILFQRMPPESQKFLLNYKNRVVVA